MIYDEPEAIENILRHVRLMRRFFNDVVDENPKTRVFLPELHCAYMDMLNEDFAPHALSLALGVLAWVERAAALSKALRKLRDLRIKGSKERVEPRPSAEHSTTKGRRTRQPSTRVRRVAR
jgi:hypothetical protein